MTISRSFPASRFSSFSLALVFMITAGWLSHSFAQQLPNPDAVTKKAERLLNNGNYKEALAAYKKILDNQATPPNLLADAMIQATNCLQNLNETKSVDELIEGAVQKYPQTWQLLRSAGDLYLGMDHNGLFFSGKFERGQNYRNQAIQGNSYDRDRIRAGQIYEQSYQAVMADAKAGPAEKASVINAKNNWLRHGVDGAGTFWRFQVLTDLTKLPDPVEGYQQGSTSTGVPVDAAGNPIFFKIPESYEKAASDGERWRWLVAEAIKVDENSAPRTQLEYYTLLQRVFDVHTLANNYLYRRLWMTEPDDKAQKDGIAAVHTLADDETIVQLATGVKRLKLPADLQFVPQIRELTGVGDLTVSHDAFLQLATIHENRRQYDQALEVLKQAKAKHPGQAENYYNPRIAQLEGNLGAFEMIETQPAGKKAAFDFVFRNGKKVVFTARKIDTLKVLADAKDYIRARSQKPGKDLDYERLQLEQITYQLLQNKSKQYLAKEAVTWEQPFDPAPHHWDRRIRIESPLQDGGSYWLEAKMDGGNLCKTVLNLEDLLIVRHRGEKGESVAVFDALTGKTVPGAEIKCFGYQQKWDDQRGNPQRNLNILLKEFTVAADENGLAFIPEASLTTGYQWLTEAADKDGRHAWDGWDAMYFGQRHLPHPETIKVFTVTDRPVYRPEQEVHLRAWIRRTYYKPGASGNESVGQKVVLTINNPRQEKVLEQTLEIDKDGAVESSLALGKDAALGLYTVQIWDKGAIRGNSTFRVEEYKKPEFEVKVVTPDKPVTLGETFAAKIKATYYFGAPVVNARVKYKIEREVSTKQWFPPSPWDWLYGEGYWWRGVDYSWYPQLSRTCCLPPRHSWIPWNPEPPETIAEAEVPIGKDGTIEVKIDTAIAKALFGNDDHRYKLTVEVTDASRRTITGSGSVLVARAPFKVYVWASKGYYHTGDKAGVSASARTPDGKPVAKAKARIVIYQTTYNEKAEPKEAETMHFDAQTDDEGKVTQVFTFPKAGQFRLSVTITDTQNHAQEGSALTVVRDNNFNGEEYRFGDLELILDKNEYAPGDEVKLLVNTNRAGSPVLLFLRPSNGIYPAPIVVRMDGKSTLHTFKIDPEDQPNFFIEAVCVSDAKAHQQTKQVPVPPKKRVAKVELTPVKNDFLPQETTAVRVKATDADGKPYAGPLILTGYDKALEYISGGDNTPDILTYFWGWKRQHYPQMMVSLHQSPGAMWPNGTTALGAIGIFGGTVADDESTAHQFGMQMPRGGVGGARSRGAGRVMTMSAMPASAPMAAAPAALGMAMEGPAVARKAKSSLADAAKDEASAQEQEAPSEPLAVPTLRQEFADLLFWKTDVTTDADGTATFEVKFPDNLTTWKMRAWSLGPNTQVGEASVEVITKKNLLVRLQAPRFFTERDEVVLSANVHNDLPQGQPVKAVLELEGGTLELLPEQKPEQNAEIASHGEKRFDWRVKVLKEGEAKIRVKALAPAESDAMEMTYPVYVHGFAKMDSFSGVARPEQDNVTFKMNVPEKRRPAESRLEIRFSPTIAGALVDALPYLADYPYGCTEQTLNRFVPTVITQKILKDMKLDLKAIKDKRVNLNPQEIGNDQERAKRWAKKNADGSLTNPFGNEAVFDEAAVTDMVKVGIARLLAMQNRDGGWGWFSDERGVSYPHTTAIIVHGLRLAKTNGADLNDAVINAGADRLAKFEAEELRRLKLPEKHRDRKAHPDDLDAFLHSVLIENGKGNDDMRARLYEHRLKLSAYAQALLGLSCQAKAEKERVDMILQNLAQFLKRDPENQTAYLSLPDDRPWWRWYGDEIETQAMYLRLIVATDPKGDLAPALAKYLLNNRRGGTYWRSTRDTAYCIEALAAFAQASGETDPDLEITVSIDGEARPPVKITRDTLFRYDNRVVLEGESVGGGAHTVELKKTGQGSLYANAYLSYFTLEDNIPASGLEIKVARKYFKLTEEKTKTDVAGARGQAVEIEGRKYRREELAQGATLTSGELVEVELTLESKNDYEYLLFEDLKPAGFEAEEVRSGYTYEALNAYREFRDEKVAFFAQSLPRGRHLLRYRVKAEIPGQFSALPTKATGMYAPELRANSDEMKVQIEDRKE